MRIHLDKIASSTRNAALDVDVVLGPRIPARPGTVVVGRVLDDKSTYNQLEDTAGRMRTVHAGDIVAGVLGERRALRGYSGEVPDSVEPGQILHLLNLGGVIGRCTSGSPQVGPPARIEILGTPLDGLRPASIFPGPIALSQTLHATPPCVFVLGTCMHAGKTAAACTLVRELSRRGLRVGAAKLTGVALRRDTLELLDHGASCAYTFADAGLPSTCAGADVVPAARGMINALGARDVDVAVLEFGDGLLGEYGVMELLEASDLAAAATAVVLAATDPVAAWGGVRLLEPLGYEVTALTGPATDNPGLLHVAPAANARTQGEQLGHLVAARLGVRRLRGVA